MRFKPSRLSRRVTSGFRDNDGRCAAEAGKRMRCAQARRDGKLRAEAEKVKGLREVRDKLCLAAEEMRHAGDIEPKPILAANVECRTVTDAEPRERAQGRCVTIWR